jgi:hypothetical protein
MRACYSATLTASPARGRSHGLGLWGPRMESDQERMCRWTGECGGGERDTPPLSIVPVIVHFSAPTEGGCVREVLLSPTGAADSLYTAFALALAMA